MALPERTFPIYNVSESAVILRGVTSHGRIDSVSADAAAGYDKKTPVQ
jgi:hypothetical protein